MLEYFLVMDVGHAIEVSNDSSVLCITSRSKSCSIHDRIEMSSSSCYCPWGMSFVNLGKNLEEKTDAVSREISL